MPNHRNVLFIVTDQWRGDTLGCLGHPGPPTPNLDALAAEGVLFRSHFGQSAPCSPARASLLTGLYVMNHRVVANGVPLDARHATLPGRLRSAGIDPLLIGYTSTTLDPRQVGAESPGFREPAEPMDGFRPLAWFDELEFRNYFAWAAERGLTLPADPSTLWRPAEGPPGPTASPSRIPAEVSDTAWSADHAISFLRGRQPNRPWLLHLGFYRPHPPFAAPAPYHQAVPLDRIPTALRGDLATEAEQHPLMAHFLATQKRSSYFEGAEGIVAPLSDAEVALTRRSYYGLIAEIDHQLGLVFSELRRTGQWDNTLIVFTSDHAEQLGDHHLLGKLGWFDQSYHLPLIVRDPDAAADAGRGRVVEALTEAIDVMPTILNWYGLPIPRACDGNSLRPWLHGETPAAWRDAVHFEYDLRGGWPRAGVPPLGLGLDEASLAVTRTAAWKYVHFATLPPVLYDLRADPGEMRNVAGDPAYAGLLAHAAGRMLSWRLKHADRTLTHLCATPNGLVDRTAAD